MRAFIKSVETRIHAFQIDPLISTEAELEAKELPTQEELCQLASAVNEAGGFGYIISDYIEYLYEMEYDPESMRAILIEDEEHELSAIITYEKDSGIYKTLSFNSTLKKIKAAFQMLEFGQLMFDNIPNKILGNFYEYEDSNHLKYYHANGDILYESYLDYYGDFPYESNKTMISWKLRGNYITYKAHEEFFDHALIITVKDLPYYTLYKGGIAIKGHIYNIRLDETELYYHGVLVDEDGNAIPCKIDPIRTKDTVADIRRAKIFYGTCWGKLQYPDTYYYTVKFYKEE